MAKDDTKDKGLLGNVLVGYFILILHLFLIVFLSVSVVFFRGVFEYKLWIFLGGIVLVLGSGYVFYRKIKKNASKIREVLNDPVFRERPVEISFLGGVASFRVGRAGASDVQSIDWSPSAPVQQLEDPETYRRRELGRLAKMFEDGLLTQSEFIELKNNLLHPTRNAPREVEVEA